MWDLIVSVPDHCLSFYFVHVHLAISFPPVCTLSFIIRQALKGFT